MKRKIQYILQTLWPWRWARTIDALCRGVRIHPSTVLIGPPSRLILGRGTKIGSRCRFDVGLTGRLVLGEKVWMSADVEIQTETEIKIGRGATIQRRCSINGTTRIGAGCILAPNVFISSGTHPFRFIAHLPIREQERLLQNTASDKASLDRPVWIQDDCWLGTNTVICPGVTIGKGSIVGANAVVTRDVPPYTVVAGIPARVISHRLAWQPPVIVRADSEEDLAYVLSGDIQRSADGILLGIVVTVDEPLHVALATSAHSYGIRMEYEASMTINICVQEIFYTVDAGCGVLELPPSAIAAFENFAICQLRILAADIQGVLYIHKIETRG